MISKEGTHKPEDQLLLTKIKIGDYMAFDAIYDRYWAQLYSAAYKRLGDQEAAKDIVQDIFLQLWQRRKGLTIDNLQSYLLTAVRNNVFKLMAKEQRYTPMSELLEQILPSQEHTDSELVGMELAAQFEKLIRSLTPSQREIFRLRFDEELGTLDIATRLNITRKTVQNQLHKSLTQIRQAIGLVMMMLLGCP